MSTSQLRKTYKTDGRKQLLEFIKSNPGSTFKEMCDAGVSDPGNRGVQSRHRKLLKYGLISRDKVGVEWKYYVTDEGLEAIEEWT